MDEIEAFLTARVEHDREVETHPDVHAMYVVTNKDAVTLLSEKELDHAQAKGAATPILYALQPHATKDAALLSHAGHTLARDPTYAKQREAGLAAFGALSNRFHVYAAEPLPLPKKESMEPMPQRKRRKVIKQIRVKNEKGYMVTKDVEMSESDDDAPTPKPAPAALAAPAPAARGPPSKGKGAKQPSLMSFFSKSS
ncbi:hypothetical protein MEQU1_001157 [Malassezia equina]|uniref:DNA polymerase delta subunit 3 n=1 Tax=Malassezia equina TaxID=1381935 RepID=A0AAF0EBI9_9BASI|nr:hypothetical protein MEQU1_001157 [Malassezia equina]